jgi:DNA-binding Lrp family transcriptional regulator
MLDKIDKKLLYQLDLNCRQSNAQIGRIIGVSKQVIEYRINKLQSQGIISN